MKRIVFLRLSWIIIITISIAYTATGQINLQQPLAKDSLVTIGKLPNGLTYYIRPNAKPEKKVELRLVVNAGSLLENDNQQGLAHFMEHMEFNGLKHYPKNTLVDYLQKIGVQFGADLNANTGWDRTYYMLPIPTDKAGNLENGFQIVADWAGGALITNEEVNSERKVILEELRMRNKNAKTRMMRQYLSAMLNGSRYADRMPGGPDSIVQYADPDRIREFYRDWYRPDLMAVIVVGDITTDKAKALIEKNFGKLKNPNKEKMRSYAHVTPYTAKKRMVVTDAEATGYGFTLMFPAKPLQPEKTLADYKRDLIRAVFTDAVNRKLAEKAAASNPPYKNAGIGIGGNTGGMTIKEENFQLDITPVKDVKTAIDSAVAVLLQVKQYGLPEQDIAVTKNRILASYENAYKEKNTMPSAAYTDELADNFMKGSAVPGIENEYGYIKALLPTISAADIQREANNWINGDQPYFALVTGPTQGNIALPDEEGLLQLIDDAFKQAVGKSAQSTQALSLLKDEPKPGHITATEKDEALGATTYTLSNGVKVTVKPTDFKNDEVQFSGVKYGGTGKYTDLKDKADIAFLSPVTSTMGYGLFTPTALRDYLSGKNVQLKTGMSDVSDNIEGVSSSKDLETLLALTYLELTSPRKDTALLNGWLGNVSAQLLQLKADPQNAFKDTLTKVLYNNSPLAPIVIPTQQEITNIDPDRILAVYKDEFGNADGYHFFFAGNVNSDSLRPLIEKYLGGLPAKGGTPEYKDNGLRMVPGDKTFRFYKGTDNKSILLDMYHGDIAYSAETALEADMLAQAMTIKLDEIIREQLQLIYSGSVSASMAKLPYGHYNITAQMPCGPENADKIIAELDKQAEGYKKDGVSQTDLEKVKKAMTEKYRESLKDNGYWMNVMQEVLFFKSKKEDFLNFEKRVNAVTIKDLKTTANQLLGNNHFKAAMFPEKESLH